MTNTPANENSDPTPRPEPVPSSNSASKSTVKQLPEANLDRSPIEDGKRPPPLTFFCVMAFIGAPFMMLTLSGGEYLNMLVEHYQFSSEQARSVAGAQGLFAAINLAGFVGMWMMRRWGVVLIALGLGALVLFEWQSGIMAIDFSMGIPAIISYFSRKLLVIFPILIGTYCWKYMKWA